MQLNGNEFAGSTLRTAMVSARRKAIDVAPLLMALAAMLFLTVLVLSPAKAAAGI
jgi:hypothetical protein